MEERRDPGGQEPEEEKELRFYAGSDQGRDRQPQV